MYNNTLSRLSQIKHQGGRGILRQIRHGIEKEGLRVTPVGQLAQSRHPDNLGAALTHPYITTDYSEALLEFITPVFTSIDDTLDFLDELHRYTAGYIGKDTLWASSMPARLMDSASIPVADYGTSNIGQMKHVYRQGLAHRYGKSMQTIAGIHYNFSLPKELWSLLSLNKLNKTTNDNVSEGYISLIRNFSRYSWLLMYLFGASPAADKSFLPESEHSLLERLGEDTLYLPWATSLRMSDIGYTNKVQESLDICYNSLDEYITSLYKAIRTPYAPYAAMGVKKNGKYLQLNTNILQIENEYYSTIRPKRVVRVGEKPLEALRRRGVEYIEVRCLDINPLEPLGIDRSTACFMDTFLTFCALSDSPEINRHECKMIKNNFQRTVQQGREPGLILQTFKKGVVTPVPLAEIGSELITAMHPVAEVLDCVNQTTAYSNSLTLQQQKLENSELTPSAQVLKAIKTQQHSFLTTMLSLSQRYQQQFLAKPLNADRVHYFQQLARLSHVDQRKMEQEDIQTFDAFLADYFSSA